MSCQRRGRELKTRGACQRPLPALVGWPNRLINQALYYVHMSDEPKIPEDSCVSTFLTMTSYVHSDLTGWKVLVPKGPNRAGMGPGGHARGMLCPGMSGMCVTGSRRRHTRLFSARAHF